MGLYDDQYEAEQPNYREMVVWGFYEDMIPSYVQGSRGEHELSSAVSADEVTHMMREFCEAVKHLDDIVKWAEDLGYYADIATELAPVFQRAKKFLETENAKRVIAVLTETK